MNGFWGADTEALRTMGMVCSRRADALEELEGRLSVTLESVEWTGEDAERFRADWAASVRPGLQDRGVELRQQARRLAQHAEEQEAASSPDSAGGPWSGPGEFLADMARIAEGVLRDLLGGGGAGGSDGAAGRFAELLREVLSTPEGRAAFLAALLGSLLGGLLAELLQRGLALGMMLEELLAGLGAGGGAGAAMGDVIGEDGRLGGALGEAPAGSPGGASGDASGGTEGSGSSSGSSSGGSGGGGSEGGGSPTGGEAAPEVGAGSSGGDAAGGARGLQGLVDGPAPTPGSTAAGRLDLGGAEEPGTLFERLIAMLGEMLGGAPGGGAADLRGTSAIGEGIGWG